MAPIRITIWNEFRHEREERFARVYPDGIHGAIAQGFAGDPRFVAVTAVLDEPEHGLTEARLAETDVLVWWGHMAHGEVDDAVVERVHRRVLEGMGLIVLHSGHFSKIFKRLMGTSCDLKWREADDAERIWTVDPSHPIADGIPESFLLPREEMYGEHFDVPAPDRLVFVSWFSGGEVFRSGCCYSRGAGRVFYFRPGHESHPTFFDDTVRRVIRNAAAWAAPASPTPRTFGKSEPANAGDRE